MGSENGIQDYILCTAREYVFDRKIYTELPDAIQPIIRYAFLPSYVLSYTTDDDITI